MGVLLYLHFHFLRKKWPLRGSFLEETKCHFIRHESKASPSVWEHWYEEFENHRQGLPVSFGSLFVPCKRISSPILYSDCLKLWFYQYLILHLTYSELLCCILNLLYNTPGPGCGVCLWSPHVYERKTMSMKIPFQALHHGISCIVSVKKNKNDTCSIGFK